MVQRLICGHVDTNWLSDQHLKTDYYAGVIKYEGNDPTSSQIKVIIKEIYFKASLWGYDILNHEFVPGNYLGEEVSLTYTNEKTFSKILELEKTVVETKFVTDTLFLKNEYSPISALESIKSIIEDNNTNYQKELLQVQFTFNALEKDCADKMEEINNLIKQRMNYLLPKAMLSSSKNEQLECALILNQVMNYYHYSSPEKALKKFIKDYY